MLKKLTALILAVITPLSVMQYVSAEGELPFDVDAKSAVLMDAETGTVVYAKNENEPLPPASVTKVMTLLLVMEAIDSGSLKLTDEVSVSDNAASMGGSQVFLEPGENMTVEEMLKCVIISSANDAAVALAEKICGSEEVFVTRMNERAKQLGMTNTHFENPTGLDDSAVNHVTSALDIAIMSRELLKHPKILEYSGIWMDTVRDGAFGLTNTNRLIRFYSGATGLKTGSTSKAGFCISATAKRNGMHLIAVVMGSPSRDVRNNAAKTLLDWGFANYGIYTYEGGKVGKIPVTGSTVRELGAVCEKKSFLLPAGDVKNVKAVVTLEAKLTAPVGKGTAVGKVTLTCGDGTLAEIPVTASQSAEKTGYFGVLLCMLRRFLLA